MPSEVDRRREAATRGRYQGLKDKAAREARAAEAAKRMRQIPKEANRKPGSYTNPKAHDPGILGPPKTRRPRRVAT